MVNVSLIMGALTHRSSCPESARSIRAAFARGRAFSRNVKCDRFRPVNNVQNDTSSRNGCTLSGDQLEDVTMPRTIAYRVVDRPDVVIDEIVASCNGDMRGAFKALLLVNEQLESELNHLYEAAYGSPTERAAKKSLH